LINLFRRHPHLLTFGILTAAFSSPGQTFLISLFIGPMRESLGMSPSLISGLYALATVVSALVLPLHGRSLDAMRLVTFTLVAGLLLASGCFVLANSVGVISVFIGFLLIRNLGQGTLTMISSTTMARMFGSARGQALGIANLGYPLSEAIFPFLIAYWIHAYGWRSGWLLLGALLTAFFSPAVILLLRRSPEKGLQVFLRAPVQDKKEMNWKQPSSAVRWTLRDVLMDKRFYLLQIPMMVPPAFLTGLFFHQTSLMAWKGWDLHAVSAGFVLYAVARGVVSVISGPYVDRLSARNVFRWVAVPLSFGLLALAFGRELYWVFIYLVCAGLTVGLSMTVSGAVMAEVFGVESLGAIRGYQSAVIVFATAAAPFLMGLYLDAGWSPIFLLMIIEFLTVAAVIFSFRLFRNNELLPVKQKS